ncbi:hypothetical protein CAEBREN_06552 [Caenorhabditis brenneri]|uniref:PAN-3 domain-containing protein n=1 Tax=Caenorhabditis brenneri TaxID=135651 RepID=G0NPD2_CAEBE|nr:hypothetical protein CAEBREN_06552 [Caenorhabditis brenneri]
MFSPVVFLLFFLLPCAFCDTKLMEIYGKVIGTTQGTLLDSNCLIDCYYDPTCFLVYLDSEGVCTKYSYLNNPKNLSVIPVDDGSQVYFKATLPNDTCPATLITTSLTYTPTVQFSFTWTPTANGWTFPGCADGWHLSVRSENLTVCMKGFYQTVYRTSALSNCKAMNAVLIGVQSVEESQWMREEIRNLTNNKVSYAPFWIDGVRNCTGIEPGCRIFSWADGLTTGNPLLPEESASLSVTDSSRNLENCLVITASGAGIINDVGCGYSQSGIFCGYKLN